WGHSDGCASIMLASASRRDGVAMIERTLFSDEHRMFRDSVRRFMDNEVVPRHEQWEDQGYVDREVWRQAGEQGLLCATMPEEYGGAGADKLYSIIVM